MILAFKGFVSIIFFLFLSGYVFVSFTKVSTIEKKFLFSIIISLWMSWILIVIINFFKLNFGIVILLSLIFISFVIILRFDKKEFFLIDVIRFFKYLLICALIITVIFAGKYVPVFVHGDAVFQWNGRWAWSLYQNDFESYGNYPVFWPGLWALIYKSIGTFENWIFANFTLIIILIISFLVTLEFKKKNFKLFLINFLILIYLCIALYDRFFIGYMDGPLTLLFYSCINLIILFSLSKNFEYILYSAFLISIATITKQQGFILPVIFFVSGILFIKNKLLNINKFLLLYLIVITHFVILSFLYGSNPASFLLEAVIGDGGNQNYLNELSKQHIKNENILLYSLTELSKRFDKLIIISLFFLSSLNILYKNKNVTSKLGLVFFIFSIVSFFYFSNYGSYDERNGWFILPLLIGGFICFLNNFKLNMLDKYLEPLQNYLNSVKPKHKKIKSKYIVIFTFIFFTATGLLIEKIVGFQDVQKIIQEQLGDKELALKARSLIDQSNDCTKIYSNLHIIVYNYHLMKFYNLDKSKTRIEEFGGWNFEDKVNNNNCRTGQIWITNSSNYPKKFKELLKTLNYQIHHPNLIQVK